MRDAIIQLSDVRNGRWCWYIVYTICSLLCAVLLVSDNYDARTNDDVERLHFRWCR